MQPLWPWSLLQLSWACSPPNPCKLTVEWPPTPSPPIPTAPISLQVVWGVLQASSWGAARGIQWDWGLETMLDMIWLECYCFFYWCFISGKAKPHVARRRKIHERKFVGRIWLCYISFSWVWGVIFCQFHACFFLVNRLLKLLICASLGHRSLKILLNLWVLAM